MPKFTYSASKGIEQSNGSGFIIQNVPISRSIANSGTAMAASAVHGTTLGSEEVYIFDLDANSKSVTFSAASAVGEQKVVITSAKSSTPTLTITNGDNLANPAIGSVKLYVWNGSAWKALS